MPPPCFLPDVQSRKIAGDMFVNFKAQRLSDSHSGGPEKNEEHLLSSFGAACNRLYHRTSERWLPLVFHFEQIDEFVVPGPRMDSFPILVDDLARRDNWRECGEHMIGLWRD